MLLARTTLLVFSTHVGRIFTSRRGLICLVLAAVPAAVAAAIAHFSRRIDPVEIAVHLGGLLLLQIVVPVLALIAGSAVVAEEVEDRTVSYLFSRPMPRPALLFGRWLATLVFLTAALAASAALLLVAAAGARAPGAPLTASITRPLIEAVLLGGAVYSALFAVAGIFFRHPMLVGLGYVFAIEGFLANLPGRNQALTVQYYLRSWLLERGGKAWNVEGLSLLKRESAADVLVSLGVILVLVLALGAWRIARREFVLTS